MTNQIAVVTIACAIFAFEGSAHAQSANNQSESPTGVEFTPYASLGSAASRGIGAGVRWPLVPKVSLEVETDYRAAPNALSSSVSLLYDLPQIGRVTPYVAAGVGLDQYSFAEGSPRGLFVTRGTAFTINAGGGISVPVDQSWSVRTDARWFNGIGRKAPERWRLYNGVTFRRP